MRSEKWIHVDPVKGGQVVFCALCGRRSTRRFFLARDTSYSEAFRLATAYEATHRMSDMHRAALSAFHSDEAPRLSAEEKLLAEIFGGGGPDEKSRRKDAARQAASKYH